jgi:hypothetical protein
MRAATLSYFFLYSPFAAVLFLYPYAFGGYRLATKGLHAIRQWSIKAMLTVIESPLFTKRWPEYWSEEERAEFAVFIANAPKIGDVIPGSGGCRKIRWMRPGMGKRGGVRVIYTTHLVMGAVVLLVIYPKSARDNIPAHVLKQIVEEMGHAAS